VTTGLVLINLGTPAQPTPGDVRRYLREFLSDPYVIDIHPLARWLLLNLIILPFRPQKSSEAYRKIWDQRGSPLLYHSRDLADAVQQRLGARWHVELAMRYGQPSISAAVRALRAAGVAEVIALPLYPQYALSSTATTEQAVRQAMADWPGARLRFVPPFYDHPQFLDAFAAVGRPIIHRDQPDHVLFSFHGLPERHIRKTDASASHCLASANCCAQLGEANRMCYRAHSFATARGIAARLGLAPERWSVSFQSRLGRTPWIRPYTDQVVVELPARGIKTVAVFCPAFVADCLETLEEIGIRAEQSFRHAGGQRLTLVPGLNSTAPWTDAVAQMARDTAAAPRAAAAAPG
jgi:protoporphyrin/coproporphyrin ferrochelatase